jgi:hypothetical protein
MEPKYEEQFTGFVDFLGFSEVSKKTDEATRLQVLALLLSLAALRGEFNIESTAQEIGTQSFIKPAISTFSDHILISYPLSAISAGTGFEEPTAALLIMHHFARLLTRIAAAALRIGFLVRGGATIGKLHYAQGVVFGEALVDAHQIESRTSVYPRVVLSPTITSRPAWMQNQVNISKDSDGLYHVDYFSTLLLKSAPPGEGYGPGVKAWLDDVIAIISKNLAELESQGRLNELSKWAWFARQFRAAWSG